MPQLPATAFFTLGVAGGGVNEQIVEHSAINYYIIGVWDEQRSSKGSRKRGYR